MRTKIIVEIGNSHEGSLGIAKSMIDMVASTGADAVKFQMHMAKFEGTPNEEFRVNFSEQDTTRSEYWERVSFSDSGWQFLSRYAIEKGLEFLCTPFSVEAADRLSRLCEIKRWKVGSGDATNFPLIDHLISTNLPLLISTGLISFSELEKLKNRLVESNAWNRTTLLHCVSQYPTPLEYSSLNLLQELKNLGGNVGLSDHSGKLSPSLLGLSYGISVLEIHLTPHELFFGPDVSSSLTVDKIKELVQYAKEFEILRSTPKSKEILLAHSERTKTLFRKGIYWRKDLLPGEEVQLTDLQFLKPVIGMDSIDFEKVVGKRVIRNTKVLNPVMEEDFE